MRPNAIQAPVRLSHRYQQCQKVALTEDRCVEGQNSGAGQEISSLSSMMSALLRCCGARVRGCIGVRRVRRLRELVGVCRQKLPRCARALRTARDVVGVHERSKLWRVVMSLPCAFPVGGHKELSHPLCIDWLRAFASLEPKPLQRALEGPWTYVRSCGVAVHVDERVHVNERSGSPNMIRNMQPATISRL